MSLARMDPCASSDVLQWLVQLKDESLGCVAISPDREKVPGSTLKQESRDQGATPPSADLSG